MDGNLWWSQVLERTREPARTNESSWKEDATANFVVLDANFMKHLDGSWVALASTSHRFSDG